MSALSRHTLTLMLTLLLCAMQCGCSMSAHAPEATEFRSDSPSMASGPHASGCTASASAFAPTYSTSAVEQTSFTAPNIQHTPKPTASPSAGPSRTPLPTALPSTEPSRTPPLTPEQYLSGMTLQEKIGQMFLACCPSSRQINDIMQYRPGGYLLFSRDFADKTADEVRAAIQSYQDASVIPMLIATDEEGGTVVRVSRNPALRSNPFPSPQELCSTGGMQLILEDAEEKSRLLKSLGINVNMAPVCDVSENPEDYIFERTLGKNAAETAEYIRQTVSVMAQQQIGSVLKHFPGYGGCGDTHSGLVTDNRPMETFTQSDFLPFYAGIESGCGAVLVSHNIVSCMDPDNPASLSPAVHEILRNTLGFEGVIITDELSMGAIAEYISPEEAAVKAVLAGNNLICSFDYRKQIPAVIEAVESGEIPVSLVDDSVRRILLWKASLGLIELG